MKEDSVLLALKQDGFRIGDCEVMLYDRSRTDVFPPGYLTKLWQLCKDSGRRSPLGILPSLFCGMTDLSHDAITTYLATRPVIIAGIWIGPEEFKEAGIGFPSTLPVIGNKTGPERALFAGYGLFKEVWGRPEAEILGMLGLAYFFVQFDVTAIHGLRYPSNGLTARFTRTFGFRENGLIPRYMMQGDKLVGAVSSTLFIEDFEQYVEQKLVRLYKDGELNGRKLEGRISGSEPGSNSGGVE
jgi:hypothetical protein